MQTEIKVPSIMQKDGVKKRIFDKENLPITNITEIIQQMPKNKSWCYRIINTENNSATLIAQKSGEGNRLHHHPNWNEWWYIIQGCWRWYTEGETYYLYPNQIVFIEKNKKHKITAIGKELSIRLAVSRGDVPHVYK